MTNQLLNDRYQIIQTLGSGGFGETFLAEDTQMPSRRRCVVKKLRPTQNNPALTQLIQERFQREAAILETLSSGSKQIPQLYAYFYSEKDQQFYLVQEWIDGQTLSALLPPNGRMDESTVRKILTDILPVFSYIHSRSIVHRDIKPDNIILRHSDRLPVLIDFGAVRESMGTVMNSQGQPTQSIVIGTPGYMPSEQSIGRPVYNSDLYSLGLTAIFLLTGQQPSSLPTDPSSAEILWRSQAPQVSSSLAQVLDKAISYHHRDRYQSAQEFLAALTGEDVTMSPNPAISNSNVATYAVSPGHPSSLSSTPASPVSNKNKLMVGGAIAATIIGGTMATALFLNNSNSKSSSVANNPAPLPARSTASSSPAPTEIAPSSTIAQNSSAPSASPVVAQASPAPASAKPPASAPAGTAAPSAAVPASVAQSSKPATQPTDPAPIASSSPSSYGQAPTTTNTVNPANTIAAYYNSINSRDYQAAWSKLPVELREDRRVHPAGYSSFAAWWNSIDSVDVRNVRIVNQTAISAEAIVNTVYRMKNGNSQLFRLRYWMVWDATTQTWQIAKVRA